MFCSIISELYKPQSQNKVELKNKINNNKTSSINNVKIDLIDNNKNNKKSNINNTKMGSSDKSNNRKKDDWFFVLTMVNTNI